MLTVRYTQHILMLQELQRGGKPLSMIIVFFMGLCALLALVGLYCALLAIKCYHDFKMYRFPHDIFFGSLAILGALAVLYALLQAITDFVEYMP
ncbi:hypothetical protein BSP38_043 [Bacillus phage BSP38]|uniref:Uncharacterized protein n=1 Tax=Bacillus phage BSP38 TaxID=2283013 RepID=A0A345MJQ3_BPBSP|nr:hypothetical protein HWB82_gp043 [Bacillus phage BSP38]AXH71085.1 hypothetical protein BSP38_043 [Bacillus phage BSP38]